MFSKTILLTLTLFVTVNAQTIARWKPNTQVRIFLTRNQFTQTDQSDLQRAVDTWSPYLPKGIIMSIAGETNRTQTCAGCMTVSRGETGQNHLGKIEMSFHGQFVDYATIVISTRAGSGALLQSVFAHEIGHSLGLDDCKCNSLMGLFPQVHTLGLFPAGKFRAKHLGPTSRDIQLVSTIYNRSTQPKEVTIVEPLYPDDKASLMWQSEIEAVEALKQYSFKRRVTMKTLDESGAITGEYIPKSRMVPGDDGKRIEKTLNKKKHP